MNLGVYAQCTIPPDVLDTLALSLKFIPILGRHKPHLVSSRCGSPKGIFDVQILQTCRMLGCGLLQFNFTIFWPKQYISDVPIQKRKHSAEMHYHQYLRVSHQATNDILRSNNKLDRQKTVTLRSPSSATIYIFVDPLAPQPCLRCTLGSGRFECASKPLADHDGDRPSNSHCRVREYCAIDPCGYPRE